MKILAELSKLKGNFDKEIQIVPGLYFRQQDLIKTIEFYGNSKYLNGQTDELGREKPFYNILNAMCDVENAAKDLDTSDIQVISEDGQHYVESFLMSKDIYEWMKEVNFARTLNEMRDTHTRYGSLLVKKVKKDGQLTLELPEWKNVICDQADMMNSPIVEKHYMTATQLKKMKEWKNHDKALDLLGKDYQKKLTIYEVRGDFPVSVYKEANDMKVKPSDEKEFTYQLYYFAGGPKSEENTLNSLDASVLLYSENDTERVYKYLQRKRKAGRSFGVGVFEEGEEAQVWTNDAVLKQFRAMEYTTKVVGQTASKKLRGRNLMTEVDDGQILEHEDGRPITALNLLPAGGLSQYPALIEQWFTQFERATSAYSALRGESPTSRTSFKLQEAVLQQSSSVMQNLQEELGIFITEIFEEWIMPFLAKRLNTKHILAHDFSLDELKAIDEKFATASANRLAKEMVLGGNIVTLDEYEGLKRTEMERIQQTGAKRFLDIPKDYYKKMTAKISVNITGERQNKATMMESLFNIMQVYAKNPQAGQDPVLSQIFMRIIEMSGAGISPAALMTSIKEQARVLQAQAQAQQAQQGQQPQQQPVNQPAA